MCSRILPVVVFCVKLQGCGVTPLKYGEIYDIDFVANFMENATMQTFWKLVYICQTYERMYSGTVFIVTWCIMTAIIVFITCCWQLHHSEYLCFESPVSVLPMHCVNEALTESCDYKGVGEWKVLNRTVSDWDIKWVITDAELCFGSNYVFVYSLVVEKILKLKSEK